MNPQDLLEILERANTIASNTALNHLLDQMLELILEVAGADAGTLYLIDRATNELVFSVVKGDEGSQALVGRRISIDTGLVGATVREGQPIVISNVRDDPRWHSNLGELHDRQLGSMISFPLLLQGQPLGVIQIFNAANAELRLIQLLGNRMASEIDKSILLAASERRGERMRALIDIIGKIGATLDRDTILRMIMDYARELLDAEASSLFLVDELSGDMILHIASSDVEHNATTIRVPAGKGIIGHVVQTGESVLVADVSRDQRHYATADQSSGFVTRSILAVPLHTRVIALGGERGEAASRIIGGLEALNKLEGTFDHEDTLLLETLANQAATVLEIAKLYGDANELFLDVIHALTAAIDAKDPYTEGHSQRVSDFSVSIARQLGLDPEFIHHIRVGGILHDVGKIGVPDHVLKKPGRLTDEEFDEMKKHPTIGERIMGQVRMLRTELPALSEHHERLDGSGYPNGLHGEEISLMGRIVAVADAFDAMTSDRPYRAGLPVEEAFRRLRAGVGTEFDPVCVDALVAAYFIGTVRTQKEREQGQSVSQPEAGAALGS